MLSKKQRNLWLARIHREDLEPEKYPYTRICSRHFITGEPSDLYDETLTGHPRDITVEHLNQCLQLKRDTEGQ